MRGAQSVVMLKTSGRAPLREGVGGSCVWSTVWVFDSLVLVWYSLQGR